MRKIRFLLRKKEYGYANIMGLVCMIIVSLCVGIFTMQVGKLYTSKCYSQTTADSVANAIASYSSLGTSFDIDKAEEMYYKLQNYYPKDEIELDKAQIPLNHIYVSVTRSVSYPWGNAETSSFWGPFFNINVNSVTSIADVELVPQSQLAKIKGAFPSEQTSPLAPFVSGSDKNVRSNDATLLDALYSQFYIEGRNRYRYTDEKNTTYGYMDAYSLLLADVLTTLGYSPYLEGFSVADTTNGRGSDKPLTDGYIYVGNYQGHDYIIYNTEEKDKVKVLYLDESKEDGMSKLEVDVSEISNIRKSPSKWYTPKNEEEINKEENTRKYF